MGLKPVITATEFEDLYRVTAVDLFNFVRRRYSADAEEIVAETYAVAWRRRHDLPDTSLRRPWLFGVARNLLLAQNRLERRESTLTRDLEAPVPSKDVTDADGDIERVVAEALARLAPAHREVLQLVEWEGLSPFEVAVTIGVRPGTARVRLHRARQALASDPEIRRVLGLPAGSPADDCAHGQVRSQR